MEDSGIMSLLNDSNPDHGNVVSALSDWCDCSFLQIKKTKKKAH